MKIWTIVATASGEVVETRAVATQEAADAIVLELEKDGIFFIEVEEHEILTPTEQKVLNAILIAASEITSCMSITEAYGELAVCNDDGSIEPTDPVVEESYVNAISSLLEKV